VIAVLGEMSNMSSEASSRATLDLPGIQQQMLETVAATGKPVVLVLENGRARARPLDIRWASERARRPAYLYLALLGRQLKASLSVWLRA
jgi:beta-glucosidase